MNASITRVLLGFCLAAIVPVFAEVAPPAMPAEVTLTTGRILRNVQVVRWEKERVVLKYTGGVDPIPFSLIAEPLRSRLVEIRAATAVALAPQATRMVSGQVFVTTKGAGAYKFAGAHVFLLDESGYSTCKNAVESYRSGVHATGGALATYDDERITYDGWLKALADQKPLTGSTTDAEGIYRLSVPTKGTFYVVCLTTRIAGRTDEYNTWAVPIGTESRIDLNTSNQL